MRPLALSLYAGLTRALPFVLKGMATRAHRKMNAPEGRLCERFGQPTETRPEGALIWITAASVGETLSVLNLIEALTEDGTNVLLTTTTQTSAEIAAAHLPDGAVHQFQPIDTPAAVGSFLDHWRPDLACFVEGELWPTTLFAAEARSIPLALINARPSKSRRERPTLAKHLHAPFSLITCQDRATADELRHLGLEDRLGPIGNLKEGAAQLPYDQAELDQFKQTIGSRPVWIAASTHAEDEGAVFAAHKQLLDTHPDALCILLPRHIERTGDIVARLGDHGIAQRSKGEPLTSYTSYYIADTMGEFGLFLRLSPVVYLGGSLGPQGGHNPHEPASLGATILHGQNVRNQLTAFREYTKTGQAIEITDGESLAEAVANLWNTPRTHALQSRSNDLARAVAQQLRAVMMREGSQNRE